MREIRAGLETLAVLVTLATMVLVVMVGQREPQAILGLRVQSEILVTMVRVVQAVTGV